MTLSLYTKKVAGNQASSCSSRHFDCNPCSMGNSAASKNKRQRSTSLDNRLKKHWWPWRIIPITKGLFPFQMAELYGFLNGGPILTTNTSLLGAHPSRLLPCCHIPTNLSSLPNHAKPWAHQPSPQLLGCSVGSGWINGWSDQWLITSPTYKWGYNFHLHNEVLNPTDPNLLLILTNPTGHPRNEPWKNPKLPRWLPV